MVFGRVRQFADTLVGLGKKLGAEYVRHRLGRKMSDPSSVYNQLGADDQAMARLSKAAYGTANERSDNVAGWNLDRELSGSNAAVYNKDGRVRIAYRGTDVNNASDLRADAHILSGDQAKSERFIEAENLYKKARTKYGADKEFKLTGHSLGGSQAAHVARKYADDGVTASVFNPGRGFDVKHMIRRAGCALGIGNKRKCDAVTTHAIRGDPISMLDRNNRVEYSTRNIDSHGLDNFLPS